VVGVVFEESEGGDGGGEDGEMMGAVGVVDGVLAPLGGIG
jgi:hypothetical protein